MEDGKKDSESMVKEVFDISSLSDSQDDGKWYTIPDSKVKVKIRPIKPRILRDIRKRWTKTRIRGGKSFEDVNDTALNNDILDYVVTDWKNISKHGEDFPCNRENKIFLDGEWQPFSGLWLGLLAETVEIDGAVEDIELKN